MNGRSGPDAPIGVFDSGVGGLSVLRALRMALPDEDLLFLADQAHVPYGRRSATEIQRLSRAIVAFLRQQPVKGVVVACNTASAAALNDLRDHFPALPIVGMEPAIKPAASTTDIGRVGVLATAGTFESDRYARLMRRFAADVTVVEDPCDGLVEAIEAGETAAATAVLRRVLPPMLATGVDTLVLGCTHYPFVRDAIAAIAGPAVAIIDPAPAVARQTARVLANRGLLRAGSTPGRAAALTTAEPARLRVQIATLLAATPALREMPATAVTWRDGRLMGSS